MIADYLLCHVSLILIIGFSYYLRQGAYVTANIYVCLFGFEQDILKSPSLMTFSGNGNGWMITFW